MDLIYLLVILKYILKNGVKYLNKGIYMSGVGAVGGGAGAGAVSGAAPATQATSKVSETSHGNSHNNQDSLTISKEALEILSDPSGLIIDHKHKHKHGDAVLLTYPNFHAHNALQGASAVSGAGAASGGAAGGAGGGAGK